MWLLVVIRDIIILVQLNFVQGIIRNISQINKLLGPRLIHPWFLYMLRVHEEKSLNVGKAISQQNIIGDFHMFVNEERFVHSTSGCNSKVPCDLNDKGSTEFLSK